ncbi:MAG TPA: transposase [Burkholderiaceae bacterium]|nr:transposase [Burkholderiaceae bacterium]
MARLPRLQVAGVPVHVLLRGNNRQPVFFADGDYALYLDCLRMAAREHDFAVHGFALLPNHIHLIGTPRQPDSLSKTMQAVGRRYTRQVNLLTGRSGTLWEGRFRSMLFDPAQYLLPLLCYVDTNPVRAGMVAMPEHYRWTSFRHHAGLESVSWVSDHSDYWALGNTPFERQLRYREYCVEGLSERQLQELRAHVHSGWPLGEEAFLTRLARGVERRVSPLAKGRPPRAKVSTD